MASVEALAAALQREGYRPLAFGGSVPGSLEHLGFLGAKDHWGSIATVALLRADGLPAPQVEGRLEGLHALATELHPFAATLVYRPVVGSQLEVPLGSYATLVAVFEGGVPPGLADRLRTLRRGGRGRLLTTCWVVDAPLGKVWDNRGLPFGLPPGKGLLREALACA